jgi:hypothetical protein
LMLASIAFAGGWDALPTELRGKGTLYVDSVAVTGKVTAAKVTSTDSVNGKTIGVITPDGANRPGIVSANDTRINIGYLGATNSLLLGNGVTGGLFSPQAGSGWTATGCANVDSVRIGAGSAWTKADTSAAGDSLKLTYDNGNKTMHFSTEVKP